jgi:hypothetical protein
MLRRSPRAVTIRLAPAVAWLVVTAVGSAPARATVTGGGATEFGTWLSDTAARALQAAEPDNDLAAAGREVLNDGIRRTFQTLQQAGPAWLSRFTIDIRLQEDLQTSYDITAIQPLLRSWQDGDRLWLRAHLRHETAGRSLGDLGLFYRQRLLSENLTLGLSGAVEDRWLLDEQRVTFSTTMRSRAFELSASLFDDVPGRNLVERGVPDRWLDGYNLALAARVPGFRRVRVQAKKHWQIALEGDQVSERDDLSLQLKPFAPLEVETGTTGAGEERSWFARLRFTLKLGGRG